MKINVIRIVIMVCLELLLCGVPGESWGLKADRRPRQVVLPDASSLTIVLHGDEFFHYTTTVDGYMITRKSDSYFYYSSISGNGRETISDIRAHDPGNRGGSERAMLALRSKGVPVTLASTIRMKTMGNLRGNGYEVMKGIHPFGKHKTLVILVDYQDIRFAVPSPRESFSTMLNENGYSQNGATGSAADYFRDNSGGRFQPEFIVVGPVVLPKERAFYGKNQTPTLEPNARQMIIDACQEVVKSQLVNFQDFDSDNDGVVDNVYVFYAGHDESAGASPDAVWAHEGTLKGMEGAMVDGLQLETYACSSELKDDRGMVMTGIGPICHEFGHVLGLPDFYDTDGAVHEESVGLYERFSIMDAGNYNNEGRTPPYYTVVERAIVGWLEPRELNAAGNFRLEDISTNVGYRISATSDPSEYFLLENRQVKGWDRFLPAHGMLIYHIDRSSRSINGVPIPQLWKMNKLNSYAQHPCCYIVGAGGAIKNEAEYGTLTFPGERRVYEFSSSSAPASNRFWTGETAPVNLKNIQEDNGVVTFTVETVSTTKLQGGVRDISGNAVAGAGVMLLNLGTEEVQTAAALENRTTPLQAITDQHGNFLFDQVEYGRYLVLVSKDGFRCYSCYFTVNENSTSLDIRLESEPGKERTELKWHDNVAASFWNLPETFTAAASWTPEQLKDYAFMTLTKTEIHVLGEGEINLHIWEDEKEILQRKVTEFKEGGWAVVNVADAGIQIAPEKVLKVGFSFKAVTPLMIALDKGPMAANGGWVKYGDWTTVKEIAQIDQNWLITIEAVAGEESLYANAGQREAYLQWPKEAGAKEWVIEWKRVVDGEYQQQKVQTNQYTLSGLQPGNEYVVRVAPLSGDKPGQYRERKFQTEVLTSEYAVIRSIRGVYAEGESLILKVKNVQTDIRSLEWKLDGKVITSERITPSAGEHRLSVTIVTADGQKEHLYKIFTVTGKN